MTRKRRFFIFFTSAFLMSIFLVFSLALRSDDPLNNNLVSWLPGNRVKISILEGRVQFTDSVTCLLTCFNTSAKQVIDAIATGDVDFQNNKTNVRTSAKSYYIEIQVKNIYYSIVAERKGKTTLIKEFSLVNGTKNCACNSY